MRQLTALVRETMSYERRKADRSTRKRSPVSAFFFYAKPLRSIVCRFKRQAMIVSSETKRKTHPEDEQNDHAGHAQHRVPESRFADVLEYLLPDLNEFSGREFYAEDVLHLARRYDDRGGRGEADRDRSRDEIYQET